MSAGISYKEEAYRIMHDGKRRGLTLIQILAPRPAVLHDHGHIIKPGIQKIIRAKYKTFKPRLSAHERYVAGQTWDHATRKWVKPLMAHKTRGHLRDA